MDSERQKYQIINAGFKSVINSLSTLGKKFGVTVTLKEPSQTNLWAMVIDQFGNVASAISQISAPLSLSGGIVAVKGDKGDTPSEQELLSLIMPLIPKAVDGHTPTDQELLSLIRPLIPTPKDGRTPSDRELLRLIHSVMPDLEEVAKQASRLALDEIKPLIPEAESTDELAKRLDELPKEWLSIDHIRGDFNKRLQTIVVPPYPSTTSSGGGGTWGSITGTLSNQTDLQSALDLKLNITDLPATPTWVVETPSGLVNGSNKDYVMDYTPVSNSVFFGFTSATNSVMLALGVHFTITDKTITTTLAYPEGSGEPFVQYQTLDTVVTDPSNFVWSNGDNRVWSNSDNYIFSS